MTKTEVKELLTQVSKGEITVDEAILDLRLEPVHDIDIAQIDTHRGLRQAIWPA